MSLKKSLCFLIFTLFFCCASYADTIYLKNGKVIEGKVVNETSYYVTVIENNAMVDYFDDEIERIEKDGEKEAAKAAPEPENTETEEIVVAPTDEEIAAKRDLILTLMEANGTRKDVEARIVTLLEAVDANKRDAFREEFKLEGVLDSLVPVYSKYYTQDELSQIVAFYQSPVGKKVYSVTPNLVSDALETIVKYFREKYEAVNK